MADTYDERVPMTPEAPAIGAYVINYAGGDQDLSTRRVRGIYISTAGTLKVDFANGSTATLSGLAAGAVYPFAITKIYQVGSSAAAGHVLV